MVCPANPASRSLHFLLLLEPPRPSIGANRDERQHNGHPADPAATAGTAARTQYESNAHRSRGKFIDPMRPAGTCSRQTRQSLSARQMPVAVCPLVLRRTASLESENHGGLRLCIAWLSSCPVKTRAHLVLASSWMLDTCRPSLATVPVPYGTPSYQHIKSPWRVRRSGLQLVWVSHGAPPLPRASSSSSHTTQFVRYS